MPSVPVCQAMVPSSLLVLLHEDDPWTMPEISILFAGGKVLDGAMPCWQRVVCTVYAGSVVIHVK